MPPLCAKAALPTNGARPLGRWLATSSTKRERSRSSASFSSLQDAAAHLELEIGDAGDEVAVAGALAVAVDRALDLQRAGLDARERVGDAEAAVVVGVDAELRLLHAARELRAVIAAISAGSEPPLVSQRTR